MGGKTVLGVVVGVGGVVMSAWKMARLGERHGVKAR